MKPRLIIPLVLVVIHSALVFITMLLNHSFTTPTGFSPSMQGFIFLAILDCPVMILAFALGLWKALPQGNVYFLFLFIFAAGGLQMVAHRLVHCAVHRVGEGVARSVIDV